jgi:hypothetical protein
MLPKNMEKSAVELSVAGKADRLVKAEMLDAGVKRPTAERTVAQRAGVSPSAIENLRRGRLKNVEVVKPRINAALIAFLENQLAALGHELVVARAADRDIDFGTAEAALAQARAALRKA